MTSISQSSNRIYRLGDLASNIVETVREPLLVLDTNLMVVSANRSFLSTFKVAPEEINGQNLKNIGNGQWHITELQELLETLLQKNSPIYDFEVEFDLPVIGRRVMYLNARQIKRNGHQAQMILLSFEDITDRKKWEEQRQNARVYAENIVETVREPLLILDQEFRVVSANRSFYKTFQVTRDETENKPIHELGNRQWDNPVLRLMLEQAASTQNEVRDIEISLEFPDIGHKTMLLNARKIMGQTTHQQLILLAIEDITARKCAEEALFQEKEIAEITLNSIGDGVITTDAKGFVQYLNPVATTLTGWTVDEARGQPLLKVLNIVDENNNPSPDPIARCMEQGCITGLTGQTFLIRRDGKKFSIEDSVAPIRRRDGRILGAILVFRDITEAQLIGFQLTHQATHDALTGLVNRQEFEHRLNRIMETTRSKETDHALCYLDLDQFKVINDTCGHAAGDELLRQVGRLLRQHVRERDTLARLGGDEFGLLMEHCSLKQAERAAYAVRKALEDFRFVWDKKKFNIGASIGLVPVTRFGDVVLAADAACYVAKKKGGNRVHVYREDDPVMTQQYGLRQWVARINRALEEGRFCLYFQPISPVAGGEMQGAHYELLLRMKDEKGRIVLPGAFLPAAERYDLATKLDGWVIHTMFDWLAHHRKHLEQLYLCEINLSGHSLGDKDFLATILRLFDETNIPTEKICFEVTETSAIANLSGAVHFIQTLKDRGCRFALDDFGSGLSSFAYLKNLPVDFLKIDGGFVKNIADDPADLALVKSINEIGHAMGKRTIAEFVENADILKKLMQPEIGVDYVQGYHIGRPKPITNMP